MAAVARAGLRRALLRRLRHAVVLGDVRRRADLVRGLHVRVGRRRSVAGVGGGAPLPASGGAPLPAPSAASRARGLSASSRSSVVPRRPPPAWTATVLGAARSTPPERPSARGAASWSPRRRRRPSARHDGPAAPAVMDARSAAPGRRPRRSAPGAWSGLRCAGPARAPPRRCPASSARTRPLTRPLAELGHATGAPRTLRGRLDVAATRVGGHVSELVLDPLAAVAVLALALLPVHEHRRGDEDRRVGTGGDPDRAARTRSRSARWSRRSRRTGAAR